MHHGLVGAGVSSLMKTSSVPCSRTDHSLRDISLSNPWIEVGDASCALMIASERTIDLVLVRSLVCSSLSLSALWVVLSEKEYRTCKLLR